MLPKVGSLERRARRMLLSCPRYETETLAGPSVWASGAAHRANQPDVLFGENFGFSHLK